MPSAPVVTVTPPGATVTVAPATGFAAVASVIEPAMPELSATKLVASNALIRPTPNRVSGGAAAYRSSQKAVSPNTSRISSTLRSAAAERMSATVPAVCGVAMEVPDRVR